MDGAQFVETRPSLVWVIEDGTNPLFGSWRLTCSGRNADTEERTQTCVPGLLGGVGLTAAIAAAAQSHTSVAHGLKGPHASLWDSGSSSI